MLRNRRVDNLTLQITPESVSNEGGQAVLKQKDNLNTLSWVSRSHWRKWLRLNHEKQQEIWLILPKKSVSGTSYRDYYVEALEEAICYGWIDSRIRRVDEARSMVRFTPRKSQNWSRLNLDRAIELVRKGRMTRAGLRRLPETLKVR